MADDSGKARSDIRAETRSEARSECLRLRGDTSETTTEIGRRIGRWLVAGDVVLLNGPLGSGKTTLTQGLAAGVGVADYVTSPSFTLVNEYRPRRPKAHPTLYHVDLYRTSGAVEAVDFGLDEYLGGDGIAVVEWAERAAEAMPDERIDVDLRIVDVQTGERRIEICPRGERFVDRWLALRSALAEYQLRD